MARVLAIFFLPLELVLSHLTDLLLLVDMYPAVIVLFGLFR